VLALAGECSKGTDGGNGGAATGKDDVAGQADLAPLLEKTGIECLNQSDDHQVRCAPGK
jgi:hypothetical protein